MARLVSVSVRAFHGLDLYDPLTMPPELRKAHQANDAAVLAAYGFSSKAVESEIVSKLFEMYAKLTEKEGS